MTQPAVRPHGRHVPVAVVRVGRDAVEHFDAGVRNQEIQPVEGHDDAADAEVHRVGEDQQRDRSDIDVVARGLDQSAQQADGDAGAEAADEDGWVEGLDRPPLLFVAVLVGVPALRRHELQIEVEEREVVEDAHERRRPGDLGRGENRNGLHVVEADAQNANVHLGARQPPRDVRRGARQNQQTDVHGDVDLRALAAAAIDLEVAHVAAGAANHQVAVALCAGVVPQACVGRQTRKRQRARLWAVQGVGRTSVQGVAGVDGHLGDPEAAGCRRILHAVVRAGESRPISAVGTNSRGRRRVAAHERIRSQRRHPPGAGAPVASVSQRHRRRRPRGAKVAAEDGELGPAGGIATIGEIHPLNDRGVVREGRKDVLLVVHRQANGQVCANASGRHGQDLQMRLVHDGGGGLGHSQEVVFRRRHVPQWVEDLNGGAGGAEVVSLQLDEKATFRGLVDAGRHRDRRDLRWAVVNKDGRRRELVAGDHQERRLLPLTFRHLKDDVGVAPHVVRGGGRLDVGYVGGQLSVEDARDAALNGRGIQGTKVAAHQRRDGATGGVGHHRERRVDAGDGGASVAKVVVSSWRRRLARCVHNHGEGLALAVGQRKSCRAVVVAHGRNSKLAGVGKHQGEQELRRRRAEVGPLDHERSALRWYHGVLQAGPQKRGRIIAERRRHRRLRRLCAGSHQNVQVGSGALHGANDKLASGELGREQHYGSGNTADGHGRVDAKVGADDADVVGIRRGVGVRLRSNHVADAGRRVRDALDVGEAGVGAIHHREGAAARSAVATGHRCLQAQPAALSTSSASPSAPRLPNSTLRSTSLRDVVPDDTKEPDAYERKQTEHRFDTSRDDAAPSEVAGLRERTWNRNARLVVYAKLECAEARAPRRRADVRKRQQIRRSIGPGREHLRGKEPRLAVDVHGRLGNDALHRHGDVSLRKGGGEEDFQMRRHRDIQCRGAVGIAQEGQRRAAEVATADDGVVDVSVSCQREDAVDHRRGVAQVTKAVRHLGRVPKRQRDADTVAFRRKERDLISFSAGGTDRVGDFGGADNQHRVQEERQVGAVDEDFLAADGVDDAGANQRNVRRRVSQSRESSAGEVLTLDRDTEGGVLPKPFGRVAAHFSVRHHQAARRRERPRERRGVGDEVDVVIVVSKVGSQQLYHVAAVDRKRRLVAVPKPQKRDGRRLVGKRRCVAPLAIDLHAELQVPAASRKGDASNRAVRHEEETLVGHKVGGIVVPKVEDGLDRLVPNAEVGPLHVDDFATDGLKVLARCNRGDHRRREREVGGHHVRHLTADLRLEVEVHARRRGSIASEQLVGCDGFTVHQSHGVQQADHSSLGSGRRHVVAQVAALQVDLLAARCTPGRRRGAVSARKRRCLVRSRDRALVGNQVAQAHLPDHDAALRREGKRAGGAVGDREERGIRPEDLRVPIAQGHRRESLGHDPVDVEVRLRNRSDARANSAFDLRVHDRQSAGG
eukprot:scaffold645_cov247-Pinguiococcus_pyrenoidosus.AAC.16